MQQDVEGGHEEVPSRHLLAALPFGAVLTFAGNPEGWLVRYGLMSSPPRRV